MVKTQWYRGNTPPKTGRYWVNLERDPGMILWWFYCKELRGWETDQDDSGVRPAWANTQSPRMQVFGPVACWAFSVGPPRLDSSVLPSSFPEYKEA
jgi:hypothetical protein